MTVSVLDKACIEKLFTEARSQNGWNDLPVSDAELLGAYEIAKMGPTSMNTQPLRMAILRSAEAKEQLRPALSPGNVEKAMTAPVVVIFAYDLKFYAHLPRVFPHNPNAPNVFMGKDELINATAFRNSSLQAAYMMLAFRAVGLDVGPMSGFNAATVDSVFFANTSFKSNFICGVGHGDTERVKERLPRLEFEEVCTFM